MTFAMNPSLHAVHVLLLTAWSGSVSAPIAKRTQLLFGDPLPSIDSAAGVPALFANFVGTSKSSDFPETYISAVSPKAFSDRSAIAGLDAPRGNLWDLPVLAMEVSTHAQVLRLRRAIPLLANIAMKRFAFPQHRQCRHSELVISELSSLPAYTSVVATPMTLLPSAYNSRPK